MNYPEITKRLIAVRKEIQDEIPAFLKPSGEEYEQQNTWKDGNKNLWENVTVQINGVPLSGITCVSYKDGKRIEEVISHEEYKRRENESK